MGVLLRFACPGCGFEREVASGSNWGQDFMPCRCVHCSDIVVAGRRSKWVLGRPQLARTKLRQMLSRVPGVSEVRDLKCPTCDSVVEPLFFLTEAGSTGRVGDSEIDCPVCETALDVTPVASLG